MTGGAKGPQRIVKSTISDLCGMSGILTSGTIVAVYDSAVHIGHIGGMLAVLLAASVGVTCASAAGSGVPPQLSEPESQAATRLGVEQVLAAFVPPLGSSPSASEPSGDGGRLPPPFSVPHT